MNNGTLLIESTSWGVIEYGLFMEREDLKQKILFKMMGECGTTVRTFRKVTIASYLTISETDTLWEIGFANFRDTLSVIRTIIH